VRTAWRRFPHHHSAPPSTAYKAPINPEDVGAIVDYLVTLKGSEVSTVPEPVVSLPSACRLVGHREHKHIYILSL
jgi:hypothetical protein